MATLSMLWSRYLVHVADILLVTFFLYQLLLLIRGTRAVQIAVGVAVLAGITVLAQLIGLPSLQWLLQRFWIAGVVVIAVVFQPELRAALAHLGSKPVGRPSFRQDLFVVNEIVAATREASRRQMGMLIAIERDTGLREYIESGTGVNGQVTRELLLTIFQPPSPLHDGAVVLQSNRVAAAGCILPVSQDLTLSRLLGTRHRAAVGVTEVSDALTVCVSEETGGISVAQDGKLRTSIDPDELRQYLLTNLHSSEKGTS